MKIIGHRGAAGLALENTLESIKEGLQFGADAIEIDIRATRDGKLVLCHDSNLIRTYGVDLKIKDCTLKQLRTPCPNLPTLDDALKLLPNKGAIIELKESIDPEDIFKVTDKHPTVDIKFASFHHSAIREIKRYRPVSYCYILEHHSPFEIINQAKKLKADGVGLHYGIVNPITYLLAKYNNLDVYTYTLNKDWVGRLFKFLYRDIDICTDYPNQFKHFKSK